MTHWDDVELGRRLRALRVEPPDDGFEARLSERLLSLEHADERPAPGGARVIVGPWRRRSVRLIGATALLLAGAAAAAEGGVVRWVQTRVFQQAEDAAAPPRGALGAAPPVRRAPRPERAASAEAPAEPPPLVPELPPAPREPPAPPPAGLDVQRLERRAPSARPASRPAREALVERRAGEPPGAARAGGAALEVPRVAIERRRERPGVGERRLERRAPELDARDPRRPLEQLREVARQRRERGLGERGAGSRGPSLERLRERRERGLERRDGVGERARERPERGRR